jgi:hypothetical protein
MLNLDEVAQIVEGLTDPSQRKVTEDIIRSDVYTKDDIIHVLLIVLSS